MPEPAISDRFREILSVFETADPGEPLTTSEVVEAISEAAGTGEPGDGKVFVMPVEDALQIRTGKRGTEAV
jgi:hypothetical protein